MYKRYLALLFCLIAVLLLACTAQSGEEPESGIFFHDENGKPLTGWQEIDGNRYYLDSNGQAAVGIGKIGSDYYCFGTDGVMATGWTQYDEKAYYLRSNGTLVTGWFSLDGLRYYLTLDGAAIGTHEIDGVKYLFDATGKLTSGWTELPEGRAYADRNCHPLTGWQEIDGKRYHFNDAGILSADWITIDGFRYYFYADGTPAQGSVIIDGKKHSFASNGQEIVLVNPWNAVPAGYEVELTTINAEHKIASIAYADYAAMMADCEAAGMQPAICSSYRTQEYQEELFRHKVESCMAEGLSEADATERAGHTVAVPGTSEHQLGLALDIVDNRNWKLDESQANMPTQQWLMENSWRYGWILRYPNEKSAVTGIIYEPWHYRYVGREVAAEIHALGICLEEYLALLTPAVG